VRPKAFALPSLFLAWALIAAAISAHGAAAELSVNGFTVPTPEGWRARAEDEALRELFGRLAEPALHGLINTPPPALVAIRGVRVAASADGSSRLVASSLLIAGDAEQAVIALRNHADAEQWLPGTDFAVRSVIDLATTTVTHLPATRFAIELANGSRAAGIAFPLPDRPDALATVVLVNDPPLPLPSVAEQLALFKSIALTTKEEVQTKRTPSWRDGLRKTVWEWEGATQGVLLVRRIAMMVVLFCAFFALQLKFAPTLLAKWSARRGATHKPIGVEKVVLPIALISITLTALIVSLLVQP